MSQLSNDTNGLIGLTLSQIGLFLATGILITTVLSVVFFNDWQQTNELRSLIRNFSSLVEDMDILFFENTTQFQFPGKNYHYTIQLSSEYIVVFSKSFSGSEFYMTERLYNEPWIRSSQQNWTSGITLREYLNTTYGHRGSQNDSLSLENFTDLRREQNVSSSLYALHPFEILTGEPVYVEKVMIYYGNGQEYDFLLLYQSTEP